MPNGLDPTAKPGNSTSMPGDEEEKTPKYDRAQTDNLKRRVNDQAGKLKNNIESFGFKSTADSVERCERCGNPTNGITKTVGNQEHCLTCVLEPTTPNTTYKEAGWKAVTTVQIESASPFPQRA